MQIRNKYFTYPVIAYGNDSYDGSSFKTDVNYETEAHKIKFIFTADLADDMLLSMIADGSVKYAHHIECQQTCFRKLFLTDKADFTCVLNESDVNGLVQVCSFVMADDDIVNYTNTSFGRDYRGFKFNIDRGCILGIGDSVNITINKEREDITKTSSIFSIHRNLNPNETELKVKTIDKKIIISIPEKTCNQYLNLSNNTMFLPMLHSMVVLPALMQVLSELKDASRENELYKYEQMHWFRALKKTAEKLNIKFESEDIASMDIFKTAQQFLDVPVVKALENICSGEGEDID